MGLDGARKFLREKLTRLMPKTEEQAQKEYAAWEERVKREVESGRLTGPVRRAMERATARYYFDEPRMKLKVQRGPIIEREAPGVPPRAAAVAVQSAKAARKRKARAAKRAKRERAA